MISMFSNYTEPEPEVPAVDQPAAPKTADFSEGRARWKENCSSNLGAGAGMEARAALACGLLALLGSLGGSHATCVDGRRGRGISVQTWLDEGEAASCAAVEDGKYSRAAARECPIQHYYSTLGAGSIHACARACDGDEGCVGFGWGVPVGAVAPLHPCALSATCNSTSVYLRDALDGRRSSYFKTPAGPIHFAEGVPMPAEGALSQVTSAAFTAESTLAVAVPARPTDLALAATVTASSEREWDRTASRANDGNDGSRWESDHTDSPQWLELDLGQVRTLCSAQILFQTAYSRTFQFQTSATGGAAADDWGDSPILTVTGQELSNVRSQVGYNFAAGSSARFLRFYGTERATVWGHSFWRLSLYSTCADGSDCASAACPDLASTPTPTPTPTPAPSPAPSGTGACVVSGDRIECDRDNCDVSCDGLIFATGVTQASGQTVCGNAGCGSAAPYVGLNNFGCSGAAISWGGNCCDANTCSGSGRRSLQSTTAQPEVMASTANTDTILVRRRTQSLAADVDVRARGACSAWPDMPDVDCSTVPKLAPPECPELCADGCFNGFCDCGHARCVCKPGFSGDHCEVDVCASARCGEHGQCTARYLGGTLPVILAACECSLPYTGTTCEANPCAAVDCGSHGSCIAVNEFETTCSCTAGYSGANCEISCDDTCGASGLSFPYGCNAGISPAFCGGGCSYSASSFDDPNKCCINGCDVCAGVVCPESDTDCQVAGVCNAGTCTLASPRPDGSVCHSELWGTCLAGACVANPAPPPPRRPLPPPPPPPPPETAEEAAATAAQRRRRQPRPAPPPPPPRAVMMQVFALSQQEEDAAAQVVADALAAAVATAAEQARADAAAASSATAVTAPPPPPRPPPVATVKSSVTFPVEIAQIAQGTPARTEFESGLRTALAAQIGGGSVFDAEDIVIDDITAAGAGRRRLHEDHSGAELRGVRRRAQAAAVDVAWHIDTPPSVMGVVANLVATVAESASDITVSVDGAPVAAAAVAAPTVYTEPDEHCVGAWLQCGTDCKQYFEVTTMPSGYGTDCLQTHGAELACTAGEGDCTAQPGSSGSDSSGGPSFELDTDVYAFVAAGLFVTMLVCGLIVGVALRFCRKKRSSAKVMDEPGTTPAPHFSSDRAGGPLGA